MRQLLISGTLFVTSTLFVLIMGELVTRILASSQSGAPLDLRDQLTASAKSPPSQLVDTDNLRGLIQPSSVSDVVYELKPGLQGMFLGKKFRINTIGARGADVSLSKEPGATRVVGVGDSVMFGWGVEQDETYLSLLQQALNNNEANATRRFEFINFGTPGYNTTMEVALLESKGMQLSPDIVILHFVNNDWSVPQFMERPRDYWTLNRSFLWEFVSDRAAVVSGRNSDILGNTSDLVRANAKMTAEEDVVDNYRHMLGPKGFIAAMERLDRAITKSDGTKIPVLIVSGSKTAEQRDLLTELCARFGFHLVRVGPFVEAYFAKNHPPLGRKARRKLMTVSDKDPHPNALGHALYAQAILAKLRELQLAPDGFQIAIGQGEVSVKQHDASSDTDESL